MDDQNVVTRKAHIELDGVDSERDRRAECGERVPWCVRRNAAVGDDPEHRRQPVAGDPDQVTLRVCRTTVERSPSILKDLVVRQAMVPEPSLTEAASFDR